MSDINNAEMLSSVWVVLVALVGILSLGLAVISRKISKIISNGAALIAAAAPVGVSLLSSFSASYTLVSMAIAGGSYLAVAGFFLAKSKEAFFEKLSDQDYSEMSRGTQYAWAVYVVLTILSLVLHFGTVLL